MIAFYFICGTLLCLASGVILGSLPFPKFCIGVTTMVTGTYLLQEGFRQL